MKPITAALIVVAAVGLATAAFPGGRQAPPLENDAVAAVTLLEPVATIPLDVIPSAFVTTPSELWATAGIEGVIRVDAHTGRIRARIRTDGAVIAALADGAVWAVDVANDRLLELDRRQNRVEREVRVSGLPTGVVAAEGRLWVVGQEHASVTVVDARSLSSVAVLRFAPAELWPAGIVAGPRGIWLITGWRGEVSLIDPTTLEVVARVPTPQLDALAATAGAVWGSRAGTERAGLVRVDPWSLVADIIDLGGAEPVTALSGGGYLHVAVPGALLELDPRTGETISRVRISRRYRITALTSVGRDLWAADEASGALLRFRLSPG